MLAMNVLPFSFCSKGVAKCFQASVMAPDTAEEPEPLKPDTCALPTADTLPDLARITSCSSNSGEQLNRLASSCSEDLSCTGSAGFLTVEPWQTEQFEFVRTLQAAPRNEGQVDLMKCLDRGNFVAVKKMPNSWITSGPKEFEQQHPHSNERPWADIEFVQELAEKGFTQVCELFGVFSDSHWTYVVSEFANQGELFSWLDNEPCPGHHREAMIRPIIRDLVVAVRALHDLGIAHRDISLENVLLTRDDNDGPLTVKLIDFGMATTSRLARDSCGKKSYIAPEMLGDGSYDTFLTDAFAVGVTIFSVACREYPWNSTMPGACKIFEYVNRQGFLPFLQRRKVWKSNGKGERLADVLSKPLADLLTGLLMMDPTSRLTLGEECWIRESPAAPRASAWDSEWLHVHPE